MENIQMTVRPNGKDKYSVKVKIGKTTKTISTHDTQKEAEKKMKRIIDAIEKSVKELL